MKILDENALGNALCFDYAVEVLRKQASQGITSKNKKDIMLSIPMIVNCVFSCELFLKAILPIGTKGHLLHEDLFSKLQDDDKRIIREATVLIMRDQRSDHLYDDESFLNDLIENEDVFRQWRYFHESDKIGIKFNGEFIVIFQAVLKGLVTKER